MSNLFFTPILNPPLGSTSTRTSGASIRFYAAMQVVTGSTAVINHEERFTVLLWYSPNGHGAWKPAAFREVSIDTKDIVNLVCNVAQTNTNIYFCSPSLKYVEFRVHTDVHIYSNSLMYKRVLPKIQPRQISRMKTLEGIFLSSI